jgi:hypothetical protein
MAFLSLTKNAATVFKLDISKSIPHGLIGLPEMEDWVVDIIWNVKVQQKPGILFYNKATGFVVPLNPAEYSLVFCLGAMQEQLFRLLKEYGLEDKMWYFHELFSVIHLCRNQDKTAIAYMTQSKNLINCWLDPDDNHRVNNSYDLLKRINHDLRKINGQYQQTRMIEFIDRVKKIDKRMGIVTIDKSEDDNNELMH